MKGCRASEFDFPSRITQQEVADTAYLFADIAKEHTNGAHAGSHCLPVRPGIPEAVQTVLDLLRNVEYPVVLNGVEYPVRFDQSADEVFLPLEEPEESSERSEEGVHTPSQVEGDAETQEVVSPGPEMIVSEVTDSPVRVLVSGGPDEPPSPEKPKKQESDEKTQNSQTNSQESPASGREKSARESS